MFQVKFAFTILIPLIMFLVCLFIYYLFTYIDEWDSYRQAYIWAVGFSGKDGLCIDACLPQAGRAAQ